MKYNKILAVGVTGALLFSITGSVKPLNIANANAFCSFAINSSTNGPAIMAAMVG